MFEANHIVLATEGSGQDRIQILRKNDRVILALADGAGGRSGGTEAADLAMKLVSQQSSSLASQEGCQKLIEQIDIAVSTGQKAGETTVVIVVVSPGGVFGASVGDSGAWILNGQTLDELTRSQARKPLVGTGAAFAVGFSRDSLDGILLVATDGLLKYTSREAIMATVGKSKFNEATSALVQLVRYASGNLPDDIAIGLCRPI